MTEDVRDTVASDAANASPDASTTPLPEPTPEEAATPNPEGDAPAEADSSTAPQASSEPRPEAVDYKDRWLRTEADLQNVRRRSAREREEAVQRAEDSVLLDVIGLLDDLDRALAVLTAEQAAEAWAQGVALTAQRMRDMLARNGVTPVASVGEPFNPLVHEALLEIPAPEGVTPGCVAQEVAKGYRRGERALRAARVVVARAGSEG
ncbi:MAG: nucleotide exchange factor GrpE [Candidatus Eisenbacteria bacterium]|jgi:molecular chaperone GrpE|nr:nucleotide exchange factor GrpE [Candidatus Eisenbacteria bacterium]